MSAPEKKQHIITIRQKGSSENKPDIILDTPSYEAFQKALIIMGINDQEIERYSRESGKSPAILRRRLSQNQAVKFPHWSKDNEVTKKLIPFMLLGNWDNKKQDDQEILGYLSDEENYKKVEENITDFLNLKETPLWANASSRGVISKIDVLFATKNSVTAEHLQEFFFVARVVLSEEDPALDLPEKDRWAAGLYEKTRNHSQALRESVCDTLVSCLCR